MALKLKPFLLGIISSVKKKSKQPRGPESWSLYPQVCLGSQEQPVELCYHRSADDFWVNFPDVSSGVYVPPSVGFQWRLLKWLIDFFFRQFLVSAHSLLRKTSKNMCLPTCLCRYFSEKLKINVVGVKTKGCEVLQMLYQPVTWKQLNTQSNWHQHREGMCFWLLVLQVPADQLIKYFKYFQNMLQVNEKKTHKQFGLNVKWCWRREVKAITVNFISPLGGAGSLHLGRSFFDELQVSIFKPFITLFFRSTVTYLMVQR